MKFILTLGLAHILLFFFLESVLSNPFCLQGTGEKDKKWKTLSVVMYLVLVFSENLD